MEETETCEISESRYLPVYPWYKDQFRGTLLYYYAVGGRISGALIRDKEGIELPVRKEIATSPIDKYDPYRKLMSTGSGSVYALKFEAPEREAAFIKSLRDDEKENKTTNLYSFDKRHRE